MKTLQNFGDYSLDLLLEAILNKEIPLYFSDRFKALINKIDHPISKILLNTEGDSGYKNSFIDLDDSGLDKVSFITSIKAGEVIADVNGYDKDVDIEIPITHFRNVRYDNRLRTNMYSKYRSVTTIGRLINKLFPKEFEVSGHPGKDIQSFTDQFKSNRDVKNLELVNGSDIVDYYHYQNYVDGEEAGGTLGNSCMRHDECGSYIQFYADNPSIVSLLILKDSHETNKIRGRALVWKLSNPSGRTFMDRIYTIDAYDEELFKAYAKERGWLHKYRQNSSDSEIIVDTTNGTEGYITMDIFNVRESSTDEYPYLDTLKYYYPDNSILSSSDDDGTPMWTLEDTDGSYSEENGVYVEYYDRYYPEDDLIYCEMGDEYRLEDDAIFLDFYDKYATEEYIDDNMVECDYCSSSGYNTYSDYREQSDTVDIYGTNKVACAEYAENNLLYSEYHDGYLVEGEDVYSDYHNSYLWERQSINVYTDAEQNHTDWRAEDDETWWEWSEDGEKYDNDVTEKELKEYNDIEDDEVQEDED